MISIKKLFTWLDTNILLLLAGFLFFFIPLFPKFPLVDVLPGYIVRVRIEDFIVAFALFVWFVQVLRKKAKFKSLLLIPIIIYLSIGFISMISAVFITKTVPYETIHISKMVFHWLRRVEYMSLYLIFYSAIKSIHQVKKLAAIFGIVAILATVYGIGQKLYQWPVYSTMNREFAKGWRLVLTEHARVPSTFAGHYDFAAYLVLFLTLSAAIFLFIKKEPIKVISLLGFTASLVSLILTASRASYIAYLIAVSIAIYLLALRKDFLWGLKNWVAIVGISLIFMFAFGDLSSRFAHFFNFSRIAGFIKHDVLKLPQNKDYLRLTNDLALVYSPSDKPPVPIQNIDKATGKELPPDVFEKIPQGNIATQSASGAAILLERNRVYTPTAFAFGLSSAIRFDALWPRAIKGFLRNPLFGSGYSTLTKVSIAEFTEAESTDNDYLRALGETGLLGFLSFYGIIVYALWFAWKNINHLKGPFVYAITVGIGAGTFGLLVNALYIDVFEASKVAFTFWALMGVFIATIERVSTRNKHKAA